MNLFTAVLYYVFMFIATSIFIVAGFCTGAALRKRKNAKLAAADNSDN